MGLLVDGVWRTDWYDTKRTGGRFLREPTTLVEFSLEETSAGTLLTIVESGFDRIPSDRRAEAWRMNDGGWSEQIKNIERHVSPA